MGNKFLRKLQMSLNSKCSYDFDATKTLEYKNETIKAPGFNNWTKKQCWRTSYGQSYCDDGYSKPKNTAIPGYGGYIPTYNSENKHAKNYTSLARDCFADPKISENRNKLATTGFNVMKHDFIDQSLTATSHRYGTKTLKGYHPAWQPQQSISATAEYFKNPNTMTPSTYRAQPHGDQITAGRHTLESGFKTNYETCDGNNWTPHPILDGQRTNTEYRIRYNSEKPYHRPTQLFNTRKLGEKLLDPTRDPNMDIPLIK